MWMLDAFVLFANIQKKIIIILYVCRKKSTCFVSCREGNMFSGRHVSKRKKGKNEMFIWFSTKHINSLSKIKGKCKQIMIIYIYICSFSSMKGKYGKWYSLFVYDAIIFRKTEHHIPIYGNSLKTKQTNHIKIIHEN